jgi:hypothetical protein
MAGEYKPDSPAVTAVREVTLYGNHDTDILRALVVLARMIDELKHDNERLQREAEAGYKEVVE